MAEVLLSVAVLAIALQLGVDVLFPTIRLADRETRRAQNGQNGLLCITRLETDFQRATADSIQFSAGDQESLIVLRQLDNVTADGQQVWADELVLYWWHSKTLKRATLKAQSSRPRYFNQTEMAALRDSVSSWRQVCDSLQSLEISLQGSLVSLRIEVREPHTDRVLKPLTLSRQFFLRNNS